MVLPESRRLQRAFSISDVLASNPRRRSLFLYSYSLLPIPYFVRASRSSCPVHARKRNSSQRSAHINPSTAPAVNVSAFFPEYVSTRQRRNSLRQGASLWPRAHSTKNAAQQTCPILPHEHTNSVGSSLGQNALAFHWIEHRPGGPFVLRRRQRPQPCGPHIECPGKLIVRIIVASVGLSEPARVGPA